MIWRYPVGGHAVGSGRQVYLIRRHASRSRAATRTVVRIAHLLLSLLVLAALAGCGQAVSLVNRHAAPVATMTASPTTADNAAAPDWILLQSNSPAAVLAAAKQSRLFTMNCPPDTDCYQDLTHLGTPMLVTELRTSAARSATDVYIIPILDAAGQVDALASAALNAAHTAIHVQTITSGGSIGPLWPHLVTADEAVARVQAQHHAGLRPGSHPQLVWLPFDATALQTGQIVWRAGGMDPEDPVWCVPGTDSKDHIVGTDGHVYFLSQIPLA
jgi:hypothetical protein